MCGNDGLAQRQAKSHTPAAIDHFRVRCVKHIEDPWLRLIRDAGTVIGDFGDDLFVLDIRPDLDFRAGRRVFDGVIHDVDDDLHNQPRVHFRKRQFIGIRDCDLMLRFFAIDMAQSLRNHIVHQLGLEAQGHGSILNAGDRQQILHQVDQPHGVVVNIRI